MKRRDFIAALGGAAAAWPLVGACAAAGDAGNRVPGQRNGANRRTLGGRVSQGAHRERLCRWPQRYDRISLAGRSVRHRAEPLGRFAEASAGGDDRRGHRRGEGCAGCNAIGAGAVHHRARSGGDGPRSKPQPARRQPDRLQPGCLRAHCEAIWTAARAASHRLQIRVPG